MAVKSMQYARLLVSPGILRPALEEIDLYEMRVRQ